MACYIVAFETQTEASHGRVRERLKTYQWYCPIHHYCWAILTEQKAADVRDYVGQVMDKGERIFVIRSGTEAAWSGTYDQKNSEWLKRNL